MVLASSTARPNVTEQTSTQRAVAEHVDELGEGRIRDTRLACMAVVESGAVGPDSPTPLPSDIRTWRAIRLTGIW